MFIDIPDYKLVKLEPENFIACIYYNNVFLQDKGFFDLMTQYYRMHKNKLFSKKKNKSFYFHHTLQYLIMELAYRIDNEKTKIKNEANEPTLEEKEKGKEEVEVGGSSTETNETKEAKESEEIVENKVEEAKTEEKVEEAKTEEKVEEAKTEEKVEEAKTEEKVEEAKTEEKVEEAKTEETKKTKKQKKGKKKEEEDPKKPSHISKPLFNIILEINSLIKNKVKEGKKIRQVVQYNKQLKQVLRRISGSEYSKLLNKNLTDCLTKKVRVDIFNPLERDVVDEEVKEKEPIVRQSKYKLESLRNSVVESIISETETVKEERVSLQLHIPKQEATKSNNNEEV